jgi:hypothetical protein
MLANGGMPLTKSTGVAIDIHSEEEEDEEEEARGGGGGREHESSQVEGLVISVHFTVL